MRLLQKEESMKETQRKGKYWQVNTLIILVNFKKSRKKRENLMETRQKTVFLLNLEKSKNLKID